MPLEVNDEDIMSTDEAILSAMTPKVLNDVKLFPFSLMRQSIALDLCGPRSNSFFNAIITVWICTLNEVAALRAHSAPEWAQKQAFTWAEKHDYSLQNYKPVLDLYRKLQEEITVSSNARSLTEKDIPKNDGEQEEV